jgi:hypothetical protein
VKAAHGGEVDCQRFAPTLLNLLNQVLDVGGDYFFRRLPLRLSLSLFFHFWLLVCPVVRFCFSPAQRDKNN